MYVCILTSITIFSAQVNNMNSLFYRLARLQRGGDLQRVRSADSKYEQERTVQPGRGQHATDGQQRAVAQFGGRSEQALPEKE